MDIIVNTKPNMAISGEYQLMNEQSILPHFGAGNDSISFGPAVVGIEKQNPKDIQKRLMKMNDIINNIELEQQQRGQKDH